MADIFDLARSINARRKQASQGYASGFEDLPMQVMEMMDTRAKEKRVSLKNDSKFLSEMIANAKTPDQLNNVTNLANTHIKETFSDPEMTLYGEALNMQLSAKNKAYNDYKAAMSWADSMSNKEVAYNDGTKSGVKRKNALELSEAELTTLTGDDFKNLYEEYLGYEDAVAQGSAYGFSFGKGKTSDLGLNKQFKNYGQNLESAIKAFRSGNIITENEAVAIAMGEYDQAKKEAIKGIDSEIKYHRVQQNYIQKTLDRIQKDTLDKGESETLAIVSRIFQSQANEMEDILGIGVGDKSSSELLEQLKSRKSFIQNQHIDPLRKRKYFWTGMREGIDVGGGETLDIFVDNNNSGDVSSKNKSEEPAKTTSFVETKSIPLGSSSSSISQASPEKFDQDEFEAMMPASEMPSYEEKAYGTSFDDLVKMISPKEEPSNPERQRQSQKFDTSKLKPQEVLKTIRALPKELKKEYQDNKKSIDKKQVAKELRENKVMMNPSSLINILSLVHIPEYRKILENDLSKMLSPNGYTFKWLRNKGRVNG